MLCKICHQNQAITTDCRCKWCNGKPEVFSYPNPKFKTVVKEICYPDEVITPEEEKRFYDIVFN